MKRRMAFKGGASLVLGQGCSQVIIFARSVLVARLIGPTNFGIAATFTMMTGLMEMLSNVNLDKFLVQATDGDDPRLQRAAQLVQFSRGLFGSAALFAIAGPAARLFHIPEAEWALRWLSVVPLIGSLRHLDPHRLYRHLRYLPDITVELCFQLVGFCIALLIAWLRRDYTAVLWAIVVQWAAAAVVSHLVAERRYGWSADAVVLRRILRFGLPMALNGLVMFFIFQGDRVVIGADYSIASLGVYAVALNLSLVPSLFIGRVCGPLFLPLLSEVQEDRARLVARSRLCSQCLSSIAALFAIGAIHLGGLMVVVIYGSAYREAAPLIAWLGAAQALSIFRYGPTYAALAVGDTRTPLIGSVVRALAVGAALEVAWLHLDLIWIARVAWVAEAAALVACVLRTAAHGIPMSTWSGPCVAAFAAVAISIVAEWIFAGDGIMSSHIIGAAVGVAMVPMLLVKAPELRGEIHHAARFAFRSLRFG